MSARGSAMGLFMFMLISCSPIAECFPIRICHKYTVHVTDGLSSTENPLLLHCKSRDDDLGNHTLYMGGDFHFSFHDNIIGLSLFTCDMKWGSKHQHATVFDNDVEGFKCCTRLQTCFWRAQDDGMFFSVDNYSWKKRYDWLS